MLKLNDDVFVPLGIDLYAARGLARREEVPGDGGEVPPTVGYLDVLHGGDRLARGDVHQLQGDGDKRLLVARQYEVRAYLTGRGFLISLGCGRGGGVVYARVERIVGLARGYVEAGGEEALVGDARLQLLDRRQGIALGYQVAVGFHVGSYQAVLGKRAYQFDGEGIFALGRIQGGCGIIGILLSGRGIRRGLYLHLVQAVCLIVSGILMHPIQPQEEAVLGGDELQRQVGRIVPVWQELA